MPNRHIDRWFRFLDGREHDQGDLPRQSFHDARVPAIAHGSRAVAERAVALENRRPLGHRRLRDASRFASFAVLAALPAGPLCRRPVVRVGGSEERKPWPAHAPAVRDVYLEDWAQCSIDASVSDLDPDRQRAALLSAPETDIGDATVFNITQAENVLGIVKDDIRFDEQSAFFRLWNDYRLAGSRASLRLLRVLLYLKMAAGGEKPVDRSSPTR